jgi:hypothetical protein
MVFGVLRGLTGLPTHDFVMGENTVLWEWYQNVETVIAKDRSPFTV